MRAIEVKGAALPSIMANTPVIPTSQWAEARRAAECGLTLQEVAEDFGVDYETVRKRAQRENWLTVNRLENLLAAQKREDSGNAETSQIVPKAQILAPDAIEKRLVALHTANKLGLARAAGKGISEAVARMEDGRIEVESLQDLQTLANIAKIAWGGDSNAQNAVQVNILASEPVEFAPHFEA